MQTTRSLLEWFQAVQAMNSQRRKVRLGYAPNLRGVFSTPEGIKRASAVTSALEARSDIELFDLRPLMHIYPDATLRPGDDINAAVDHFFTNRIDGLLLENTNYGGEEEAAALAEWLHRALNIPVATLTLWDGDPELDGKRLLDAGCGIWPQRELIRRYMQWEPDWIPECHVGDAVFNEGIGNYLATCGAVREFRGTRMLQIGVPEPTFLAVYGDVVGMQRKWATSVKYAELMTLINRVRSREAEGAEKYLGDGWKELLFSNVETAAVEAKYPGIIERIGLTLQVVLEMMEEAGCNAVTIKCWGTGDGLMEETSVCACCINGILNDWGITTPCECDILGGYSQALLVGASLGAGPSMFLDDTVTHPSGRKLDWHCGNIYTRYIRKGCDMKMREGWIINAPNGAAGLLDGVMLEEGCPVTLVRVSTDMAGRFTMVTYEADVVAGPKTIGTHFWIRTNDPVALQSELAHYPVVHHWGVYPGQLGHTMVTSAYWLGMKAYVIGGDKMRKQIISRITSDELRRQLMENAREMEAV